MTNENPFSGTEPHQLNGLDYGLSTMASSRMLNVSSSAASTYAAVSPTMMDCHFEKEQYSSHRVEASSIANSNRWDGSSFSGMDDALQPTPIGPQNVISVQQVPSAFFPIQSADDDLMKSFRELLVQQQRKQQSSFNGSLMSMNVLNTARSNSPTSSTPLIPSSSMWATDGHLRLQQQQQQQRQQQQIQDQQFEMAVQGMEGAPQNSSSFDCRPPLPPAPPNIVSANTSPATSISSTKSAVFRQSQYEQWNQRYQELLQFRQEHGHCLVPFNWSINPSLAHWVKRQRHQYRMIKEGKHSTLTPERLEALTQLGFVWDSHAEGWEIRWRQLREFCQQHGHCRVPKTYPPNPPLAVWVKCQRRQYKLFKEGKESNITPERIEKLLSLGFVFQPRRKNPDASQPQQTSSSGNSSVSSYSMDEW